MQTWMYLAVPVLLYAGERTLRFFRSGFYSVRLLKVSANTYCHCHIISFTLSSCLTSQGLKTSLQILCLPIVSFFLISRLLFTRGMFLHYKCLNLLSSVIRVDSTCLSNAPLSLHLNGKYYYNSCKI